MKLQRMIKSVLLIDGWHSVVDESFSLEQDPFGSGIEGAAWWEQEDGGVIWVPITAIQAVRSRE